MIESTVPRKRWWKIQWYSDDDTPEERKLIVKLDLIVVPYAILAYWVKYIDQANLNNAYVAGMKEELGFYGNELVQLQTMYTVGAVVGMVPFMFLFTYIPMFWTIPFIDISWGVFTLLQYRAHSFAEAAAYRFLVGFFEAAFFPAMHYVFGSWYRGHEIARRGGLFYTGLNLGTLTAGLVAAGASRRLEGINGLSGWRWMYIICAIITFPVGILGFFLLPGTIDQPNRRILTDKDIEIAKRRLERNGHVTHGTFKVGHLKKIFLSPQFWTVILVDVLFWNAGIHKSTGSFLLWIKSLQRYSPAKINELGSITPALGILYNLVACFASDLILGPAWAITFASSLNAIGLVILVIWKVPEAATWFAFSTMYWSNALSSVFHGWVNTLLRDSPEERSFTLVMITIIAQSSTAWTPLLTFPTVEAPQYPKGFSFCLGCALALIASTHILNVYIKRKEPIIRLEFGAMAGNMTATRQGVLAFLADDFKQSMSIYLTFLALFVSAVLLHKLSSVTTDGREPPVLKPRIPIIGHLIGLIRHQGGYLKQLYDKTSKQIATLPILGGKLYIIFDPSIVQSAYRNKRLCFEPFAVEFAQRELAISDETFKIVQETNLVPEFFTVIAPAMTGSNLHRMNANALKYVSKQLEVSGGSNEALQVPNLFLWVRDLMTLATTEAMYGPENPVRKNPSMVDDLWAFEGNLPVLLLNIFPSITARTGHRARARLQAVLGEYYGAEKDGHEDAAQIVKSRANVLRSYGISSTEVGHFELALLHVATANTIPTLFWFMAHIFSRPDLVLRLRDEVSLVAEQGPDNEVTIDITKLDEKCRLLVSCYREAIRLSNQAVGNRRVLEDTTVSDGQGNSYLLKKGMNLQIPGEVLHTMEHVWGDKVLEFNPERFIEKRGKENIQSEKAKRAAYAPFGGGRHLCPGRNFAFAENLGFVACLLLGFDILPLDDDSAALRVPNIMRCNLSEAAAKPERNGQGFGAKIQKKKGWEQAKWRFVC
ncbi:hypothetical protein ACJZ2D_016220 [Fusarium nematophilum]